MNTQFALGLLTGLGISALIFIILAFFRAGIEKRVRIVETVLGQAGPKPKGAIFLPEDEATIARQEHIAKNKAAGKDTPIDELL
jgi:hypothetical protein